MAALGKYADLPLPREWLSTLDRLRPVRASFKYPLTLCPARLVDLALDPLDERSRTVLMLRFAHAHTLARIGDDYGLTRERVRQLEVAALKKVAKHAQTFFAQSKEWLQNFARSGFFVVTLTQNRSRLAPELTPQELWKCAFGIYVAVRKAAIETEELSRGGWVIWLKRRVKRTSLHPYINKEGRFIPVEEAAKHLGAEVYDLIHASPFFDGIFLTRSGSLGFRKWSLPSFMEAIAKELAKDGFREWHFSEMGKALEYICPERFSNIKSRNVAAALARPDASAFEYAGKKGQWRLKELGDGYMSNRDAVIAVLREGGAVLHYNTIVQRLKRSVRPESIYALLARDSAFKNYGDGFYGLAAQSQRDVLNEDHAARQHSVKYTSETSLADLIASMLGRSDHLLREEVVELPEQGGCNDELRENDVW
jgi:hypothetical protein